MQCSRGRARRAEYWVFYLCNVVIVLLLGALEGALGLFPDTDESILGLIYQFAILIPILAVGVRRIHDTGKSGWFILLPIYNLILFLTPGNKGENKFGADPKNTNVSKSLSDLQS
jgi:uncharacterized membrane protein YhaH (DUF805 family)